MKTRFCFLVIAALLTIGTSALASDRRPLREARSENERFRLRIYSGRPHAGERGRCRATLFERVGEERRERRVWREKLVNDVAPRHALIRNDGRFLVTLDEFRRGGAAHAVVVYNERGRQLREFGVRELLHGDDWQHVKVERRAVEWLPGATFAFVDQPPQFAIKLKWGREIRIDLENLAIAGDSAKAGETGSNDAEPRAAKPPTGQTVAQPPPAVGNDAIPPEILALLEQPASAPTAADETTRQTSAEAVQQALEKLQRMAEASGVQVEGLDRGSVTNVETAGTGGRDVDVAGEVSGAEVEAQPGIAGNSAAAGLPVPAPDPANPVDYLAWIMAQTETDGPSAVPFYEAAFEARVKWEGDEKLWKDALKGDPEALASPEIAGWLEANQDALANLRAATQLEYRGMLTPSEDGSLIGILLPSLSETRQLARTAIIEAKHLEASGDVEAALGNYLDMFAMGAQTSQGPTLIENLVGIAIQAQTASSLLDSFAGTSSDAIDYARLAEDLENRYRPPRPIAETFQGERAMVLDFIQRAYDWDPDSGRYRVSPDRLQDFGVSVDGEEDVLWGISMGFVLGAIGFEKMVAQTNDHYDALTEAAMLPYRDAKQALHELEEQVGSPAFRVRNPLLSVLLPSLARCNHLATRNATTRHATMLVANLRAYRQQHGTYPDSLDVFGDTDVVFDPFTGGRFAYQRDGDDFTLYSVGGNGVDDGGVHDRRGDTNDVVFWPRPPKK